MIKLVDVIDEFMLEISDTRHMLNGTNRTLIERRAKRGLEELGYAAGTRIRIEGFDIPDTKIVSQMPLGYIDYIRLSVLDQFGRLTPMYVNYDNPISYSYLRDNDGNIVTDQNLNNGAGGGVLELNELPDFPDETVLTEIYGTPFYRFSYFFEGGVFGVRGGYENGEAQYRYVPQTKEFHFFNCEEGDHVIMEYISSPLNEVLDINELEIHEYLREALHAYIYYHLVKNQREVPAYEKERSKKEYYDLVHVAKQREMNIDEIIQAARTKRGFNNW